MSSLTAKDIFGRVLQEDPVSISEEKLNEDGQIEPAPLPTNNHVLKPTITEHPQIDIDSTTKPRIASDDPPSYAWESPKTATSRRPTSAGQRLKVNLGDSPTSTTSISLSGVGVQLASSPPVASPKITARRPSNLASNVITTHSFSPRSSTPSKSKFRRKSYATGSPVICSSEDADERPEATQIAQNIEKYFKGLLESISGDLVEPTSFSSGPNSEGSSARPSISVSPVIPNIEAFQFPPSAHGITDVKETDVSDLLESTRVSEYDPRASTASQKSKLVDVVESIRVAQHTRRISDILLRRLSAHNAASPRSSQTSPVGNFLDVGVIHGSGRPSVATSSKLGKSIMEEEEESEEHTTSSNVSTEGGTSDVEVVTLAQSTLSVNTDHIQSDPAESEEDEAAVLEWYQGALIGSGAFGKVYLGLNLGTWELMAVKQIAVPRTPTSRSATSASTSATPLFSPNKSWMPGRRASKLGGKVAVSIVNSIDVELNILKRLSHPCIVRFIGYETTLTKINIFLEYCDGGSIASVIRNSGKLPQTLALCLTKQIILGLQYLHSQNIIHRDIKAANVLLTMDGCVKISDFGVSKQLEASGRPQRRSTTRGTIYWMAPELFNASSTYDSKIDIWALGCVLIEMMTAERPWKAMGGDTQIAFHLSKNKAPPIPDTGSEYPIATEVMKACLNMDPNFRPSANQLMVHEALVDVNGWGFDFKNWYLNAKSVRQAQEENENSEDETEESEYDEEDSGEGEEDEEDEDEDLDCQGEVVNDETQPDKESSPLPNEGHSESEQSHPKSLKKKDSLKEIELAAQNGTASSALQAARGLLVQGPDQLNRSLIFRP
ncbi:hypothetical protein HDV05_004800 [Chytridiales sp. JEL 0842]|nr:hypothetical protein HDV05_004800 [Chytridiales sp. JEL 0842]